MHDMELVRTYALSFLGKPYYYGGSTPMQGLDCSGLVVEIMKAFGLIRFGEDATAGALAVSFHEKVSQADLGDLAFFGKPEHIDHIGFCLNETLMLEAGGGFANTKSIDEAIKREAFVKIRPIHYRKDFLFITRPPWGQ